MGKNRFSIPAYHLNTVKIKAQAMKFRLSRGLYPYDYFKDKVERKSVNSYNLNYSDAYHSLAYFDLESGLKYHNNNHNLVSQIITSFVMYNDLIERNSIDHKRFLSSVKELLGQGVFKNDALLFYIDEDYHRFDIKGPYLSAIIQGKMVSLFVRCYRLTEDKDWLDLAKQTLNSYLISSENGGFTTMLDYDMPWMEEYPSPKPSMVLNGFLFWLIGLGEYIAISNDDSFKKDFEEQFNLVISWLPAFKLDNGLLYSMYRWNPCNVHYTAIMNYQFEHIYRLTGVAILKKYSDHLDKYTDWNVFRKLIG